MADKADTGCLDTEQSLFGFRPSCWTLLGETSYYHTLGIFFLITESHFFNMTALFETVELAPRDPIFGLNEQFNADTNPNKVNLGVGVYQTDEGKIPLMGAVHKAELALAQEGAARNYLPIDGLARYNQATQKLLFGADSQAVKKGLVATVQALGGTGALTIGADFLSGLLPSKTVYISDPSWENHRALFQRAGYTVNTYPYYNEQTKALNLDAMVDTLAKLPAKSLVVLHACCHNPTGLDPTPEQWEVKIGRASCREGLRRA